MNVAGDRRQQLSGEVCLPGDSHMTLSHGGWHDDVVRTALAWRVRVLRLEVA